LLIGFTTSFASFKCGTHAGYTFKKLTEKIHKNKKVQEAQKDDKGKEVQLPEILDGPEVAKEDNNKNTPAQEKLYVPPVELILLLAIIVVLSVGVLIGILFVFEIVNSKYTFALLCGPTGALVRHYISLNNVKWPTFPLFTFLVNVAGCVLYGTIRVLIAYRYPNDLPTQVILDSTLLLGFADCLTTVSSFMLQCSNLDVFYSWRYSLGTMVVAQLVLLVINGSYYLR